MNAFRAKYLRANAVIDPDPVREQLLRSEAHAGIVFAVLRTMKHTSRFVKAGIALLALVVLTTTFAVSASAQEKKVVKQIAAAEEPEISPAEKETIKKFDERVKQYVSLRASVKAKAPKLSKDSTPEQIQAAENALVAGLQTARASAKPGDLFTPDIAQYIRTTLKREFKPAEKKEIRKVMLEKDDTSVPVALKVNHPYPDAKDFVEMPATLLLKLPQLPKELKYRYVGRNMILVDTDNNLIVDYMLDALP
jgi:hypothetical protein